MKIISHSLFALLLMIVNAPLQAGINVFACEPEWASLVKELAGDRASIYSATTAYQDPHHIEARPSLIARVRQADMVICSGAELETGWLPMLLRQAGNSKVMPTKPGYFEASAMVEKFDVLQQTDRSMGDVHASGNPHVHLDPHRIQQIAAELLKRLIKIDPQGTGKYQAQADKFFQRWQRAITQWEEQAKELKGSRAVVHHRDWVYLFDWLGIEIVAALEPKPGLPTTAGHLSSLKQSLTEKPADMIVHTVYQSPRAAQRLAKMVSIAVVELPYTVGGDEQANDLFGLFSVTIEKLKGAR